MFRAGMKPPMPDEGAPGPMTRRQRMAPMVIGSSSDLTAEERRRFSRMPMEPVEGEEVGMEEQKSKVYKKKMASGGYTRAADGCCKKGKTRGKMV